MMETEESVVDHKKLHIFWMILIDRLDKVNEKIIRTKENIQKRSSKETLKLMDNV